MHPLHDVFNIFANDPIVTPEKDDTQESFDWGQSISSVNEQQELPGMSLLKKRTWSPKTDIVQTPLKRQSTNLGSLFQPTFPYDNSTNVTMGCSEHSSSFLSSLLDDELNYDIGEINTDSAVPAQTTPSNFPFDDSISDILEPPEGFRDFISHFLDREINQVLAESNINSIEPAQPLLSNIPSQNAQLEPLVEPPVEKKYDPIAAVFLVNEIFKLIISNKIKSGNLQSTISIKQLLSQFKGEEFKKKYCNRK